MGESQVTLMAFWLTAGDRRNSGGWTPGHVTTSGSEGLLFNLSMLVNAWNENV